MASTTQSTSRGFITQLLTSLSSLAESSGNNASETSPLNNLPDATKKQLLSLQVFFPNEFVPALDLLDRRLVTRFYITDALPTNPPSRPAKNPESATDHSPTAQLATAHTNPQTTDTAPGDVISPSAASTAANSLPAHQPHDPNIPQTPLHPPTTTHPNNTIYYVRSAQHRSSRFSSSLDTTTSYEVRLRAWSCSCPAFAFAAFPAALPDPPPVLASGCVQGLRMEAHDEDRAWVFGGVSLDHGIPPVCKHLLACVLGERCSGLFGGYVEERSVSVEEAAGWAAGWGD
ncbi:hypothetical protein ACN47E_003283 [Coniothyrium glycines]